MVISRVSHNITGEIALHLLHAHFEASYNKFYLDYIKNRYIYDQKGFLANILCIVKHNLTSKRR